MCLMKVEHMVIGKTIFEGILGISTLGKHRDRNLIMKLTEALHAMSKVRVPEGFIDPEFLHLFITCIDFRASEKYKVYLYGIDDTIVVKMEDLYPSSNFDTADLYIMCHIASECKDINTFVFNLDKNMTTSNVFEYAHYYGLSLLNKPVRKANLIQGVISGNTTHSIAETILEVINDDRPEHPMNISHLEHGLHSILRNEYVDSDNMQEPIPAVRLVMYLSDYVSKSTYHIIYDDNNDVTTIKDKNEGIMADDYILSFGYFCTEGLVYRLVQLTGHEIITFTDVIEELLTILKENNNG